MSWQNRITRHADVNPRELLAHPLNFRTHPEFQKDVLRGALEKIGFVQSVIVNERTGRLIDGHARVELAMAHEQPTVPVVYVDLDEADEKLALATHDRIGDLAGVDKLRLNDLMQSVTTDDPSLMALLDQLATENKLVPPPDTFGEVDPDTLKIEHRCPQCGYEWSGESGKAGATELEAEPAE